MSGRRSRARGRAFGVLSAALAFGAYLVLTAVPALAVVDGSVTCTYDALNKTIDLDVVADNDVSIIVGVGGAIWFDDNLTPADGQACEVATVTNTDGIFFNNIGGPGLGNIRIDLSGGPFAPGETAEATGISEIEISIEGNGGIADDLFVVGSDGDDTIIWGDRGLGGVDGDGAINLNTDGDADVTFDDRNLFDTAGGDGNDVISYAGGAGTGAGADDQSGSGPSADGEDGDDVITASSNDSDGELEGGEGNDHLIGGSLSDLLDDDGVVDDCDGDGGVDDDDSACDETDLLEGNGGDDSAGDGLFGGEGNDLLRGGAGDDYIDGEDGDDVIDEEDGPNGSDEIVGGSDLSISDVYCEETNSGDTVDYSGRNSILSVDLDNVFDDGEVAAVEDDNVDDTVEHILGGSAGDTLIGDDVDENFIAGNGGNDTLMGLDDDDCLRPGAGDDVVDGGLDTEDGADFSDGPAVVADIDAGTATGNGTDTLIAIEDLFGSPFGDTLLGDEVSNFLWGNDGDDTMDAREGSDEVGGGPGNDTITDSGVDPTDNDDDADGGLGDDSIDVGVGDDTARGDCFGTFEPGCTGMDPGFGNDTIEGGPGSDDITGQGGDDMVSDHDDPLVPEGDFVGGGPGNDTLFADFGDDTFLGGAGDDDITSTDGDDFAEGDCGGVCTFGTHGNDTFTDTGLDDGGLLDSDDTFLGEGGDDTAAMGEGDDFFDGGLGNDQGVGEAGDDELYGDVSASAKDGRDILDGGDGEDYIEGDAGSDDVKGGPGNDVVCGDDCSGGLFGGLLGDGSDKVEGGLGDDTLIGGLGADFLVYRNAPAGVEVDASLGFARGGDGNDAFFGPGFDFEIVGGSMFNDILVGGNQLLISNANFRLVGLAGDDFLTGSNGNDTLKAGKGDDHMKGLGGADRLMGANGFDHGNGGPGPDVCKNVEVAKNC